MHYARLVLNIWPSSEAGVDYLDGQPHGLLASGDLVLHEVVVPAVSATIGRTAQSLALQSAHGVPLLGISRRSRNCTSGSRLCRSRPVRQVYNAIEWPVIILLASLIPIGAAVEQSGATSVLTFSRSNSSIC